ncbi:MAG: DUF4338 domain-containing protein, partial [Verrucomicrobiae bacterium]|nr:DUF4338 domain-containing protein [Verrucomicrobiae bacterium]
MSEWANGLNITPTLFEPFAVHISKRPSVSADEQALLDGVTVRLIEPSERARFDRLLAQHHYLHSANLVGEQLRYLAACHGPWLALLSWNAAAFPLKDREAWIGWNPAQTRRRLSLVVNHSRFLILDGVHCPNL